MLPVIAFLKGFFSRKDVSIICFILAIVTKTLLTFYFLQLDNDKLFQAMAGKNLSEGHGFTLEQVHANNLSKNYYEPFIGWPPGYSVLVAIIYSLVKDLNVSCFIIDVICIILFFILLRTLLRQLEFPEYLINLLVLFNGSTITIYIIQSTPTDFLAFLLIVYNCYLSIALFRQKKPRLQGMLLLVFNILPAWFRYMYIPVTFIIPGFLLWNGWFKKDRKLLLHGVYAMGLAIISVIVLLGFRAPFEPVEYIAISEKGIFWGNLLQITPALFTAFMDGNFFTVQLSQLTGVPYKKWAIIFQRAHLIPFLLLLMLLFYSSFKKRFLAADSWQVFRMIGVLMALTIFFVLAFLSLTHNMNYPPPRDLIWTYVSADRYYIFIEFFFVLVAVKWLFMNDITASGLKNLARVLFLFLFAVGIVHGTYFTFKNFSSEKKNFADKTSENAVVHYIENTIRENKKKNIDVVVTGHTSMANMSILMGGKGLFESSELNTKTISADKPTKLVLVIQNAQFPFYSQFFRKEGQKLETKINEFYLYSYYIKPNTLSN